LTDVSEVLTAFIIKAIVNVLDFSSSSSSSIALMMDAVSTSETSVNFYQTTRRNIPENSHLQMDSKFMMGVGRGSRFNLFLKKMRRDSTVG
jgi:hypothetical protein